MKLFLSFVTCSERSRWEHAADEPASPLAWYFADRSQLSRGLFIMKWSWMPSSLLWMQCFGHCQKAFYLLKLNLPALYACWFYVIYLLLVCRQRLRPQMRFTLNMHFGVREVLSVSFSLSLSVCVYWRWVCAFIGGECVRLLTVSVRVLTLTRNSPTLVWGLFQRDPVVICILTED